MDCGHVFCVSCLQDFYNNAITEGDIASVRCLAPGCVKERSAAAEPSATKSKKAKTFISPSELLQIPLETATVKRYVDLKHKIEIESDKNTVYCPRTWCQGAARSKKYRKPQGFELVEDSDSDSDDESKSPPGRIDLMRVCEDCSFAFCKRCFQGWHGEYTICIPRQTNGELTEDEKASLEYLKLHSTPCPTCDVPSQKTHGCNHMICARCDTHYCYICGSWLEPANPYKHYNTATNDCYMRLWELEGGDGHDVGIGYAEGMHEDQAAELAHFVDEELPDDVVIPENDGFIVVEDPRAAPPRDRAGPNPPPLEREGALVLRINELPPPRPPPAAPEVQPARRAQGRQQNPRGPAAPPPVVQAGPYVQRQPGRRHAAAVARLAAERQTAQALRRRNQEQRQQRNQAGNNLQGPGAAEGPAPVGDNREAEQRAWVQQFVQLALNDQEDQLDWDSDEEDEGAWAIPVR
jgi:E3 ubiquitin-protein ligase RNF14